MTMSMYSASVPLCRRALTALGHVLEKGAGFAEAKKIDQAVLLNARLAPDMFSLIRQVQIASDTAKGGIARLAGAEVPSWPDDETSFAQLRARVARTLDFIDGFARTVANRYGYEAVAEAADQALHAGCGDAIHL